MPTINVVVTKSGNTYTWTYNNGTSLQGAQFADVPVNTSQDITVNISAATSGDTVVFQPVPATSTTPPVQFQNNGVNVSPPSWYSYSGGGTGTLTITDNNNPAPKSSTTWNFVLQASYTPKGGSAAPITSPDPTIVNVGTGGYHHLIFPTPVAVLA